MLFRSGTAYFYDPQNVLATQLAVGEFELDLLNTDDEEILSDILSRFVAETGSEVGQAILSQWSRSRMDFIRVRSVEYQRALGDIDG